MPEGAIWPAQKAALAITSIVTALSVEAEVSAVLMRCLRFPAAHLLYSGVAFSLRQIAISACKPSRNHQQDILGQQYRERAAVDDVQAHLQNSNTLSQYRCRYLPAQLSFGRSIASLPKGLFADVLLVGGLDGAEGHLLRLLLIPPKKPTCHRCIPCVQNCHELPAQDSQSVISKQPELMRGGGPGSPKDGRAVQNNSWAPCTSSCRSSSGGCRCYLCITPNHDSCPMMHERLSCDLPRTAGLHILRCKRIYLGHWCPLLHACRPSLLLLTPQRKPLYNQTPAMVWGEPAVFASTLNSRKRPNLASDDSLLDSHRSSANSHKTTR